MKYLFSRKYRRLSFSQKRRFSFLSDYRFRRIKVKIADYLYANSLKLIGIIFLLLIALFIYYSRDLPHPSKVKRKEGFSIVILDRNNKPIYDIYEDKNRIPVPFSDFPDHLKKATISIEDKDFYKHSGFSTRGILRAFINILTLKGLQGGSTLTQQLVKNVLLSSERTLPRKFKEFILAVQIEQRYSKDEILQMYLNEAPFGGTMWGIEAAAQGYFGKTTRDLTFAESVILAGLPQRPSYYSPYSPNKNAYKKRAEQVLRRMREDDHISAGQEKELTGDIENYQFPPKTFEYHAPHFVEYVKKQLIEKFGENKVNEGGLKVITTLDLELQKKSEAILLAEIEKIKKLNATNGAAVVMEGSSGEILTYIGSREYESEEEEFQGKFDVASLGLRQPGSALKPITYAVAFAKNYTASSLIIDVETKFPGGENRPDYIPKNYDNKFRGPIQLRFALGNSINIPAVKLTALIGIRDILELAFEMGLTTLKPTAENEKRLGLSITLGGGEVKLLELVGAYATLANRGVKPDPVAILKVTDTDGKVIFEHKKTSGKRVLTEEITFLISHILSDNNARTDVFGERSYLYIPGATVAVKTGTTDDKRDNWAVGYTTGGVVGVWVGNNDNSAMNPQLASGATGASPIWNRIMREYLKNRKSSDFTIPAEIIALTIDAYGGGLPKEGRPTRSEYFIKGTEPTSISPIYQKLKISKTDPNKLANPVEIATNNYEEKDFVVFEETDPLGVENRWQEGIEEWLKGQPDPIYHPPKEISNRDETLVVVTIKSPLDKSRIDSNQVEIKAEGKAIKNIRKMEIYIDGNIKESSGENVIVRTVNMENGIRKIKVKAVDEDGRSGETEITVGINTSVEPTATPVIPTPTLSPTVVPT